MTIEQCPECGCEYEVEDPRPLTPEEEAAMQVSREAARAASERREQAYQEELKKKLLYCSFCGRTGEEGPLVAGPSVYICADCSALCADLHIQGKTVRTHGDLHERNQHEQL